MKRYIRAAICLVYSIIKFCLIKLFHMHGFKFTPLNLVSPLTEIEIGKKAKLKLGKMVRMRSGSKVKVRNGAEVQIGENTSLNYGCMIVSHEKIIIGKDVQFGPNVLIYDHDHDFRKKNGLKDLKYKTSKIEIGDNVWIGANTIILKGSKIGNNCVIGAGSVIKGKFEDNTVIVQRRETQILYSQRKYCKR
ncbi:MAG: acyltransferase [Eubacteriales bacterium]